jgi:RNA polymerase sigma factor (sigma-70 family)
MAVSEVMGFPLPRRVIDRAQQINSTTMLGHFAKLREIKAELWRAIFEYHVYAPIFIGRARQLAPLEAYEICDVFLAACRQARTSVISVAERAIRAEIPNLVKAFSCEIDPDHKIVRRWIEDLRALETGVVPIELGALLREHRIHVRKTPRFSRYVHDLAALQSKYLRMHQELVVANLRLVGSSAKRLMYRFTSIEDLGSEGTIGLMIAVHRFDPAMGNKFSTYAVHWIRHMITRRQQSDDLVRIPVHMQEKARRIDYVRRRYCSENGADPTQEELLEIVNEGRPVRNHIKGHEVNLLDRRPTSLLSLDKTIGFDDMTLLDVIPDRSVVIDRQYEIQNLHEIVEEVLHTLPDVEAEAFRFIAGMLDEDPSVTEQPTLASIGEKYDLCRERIRQLSLIAAEKIRRELKRRKFARSMRHVMGRIPVAAE